MEIRSFLAFEMPEAIKTVLSETAKAMKGSPLPIRWVPVGHMHLTLVFLGSVDTRSMEGIKQRTAEACAEFGPFRIALKGLGTFGGTRSPRVLWVGLQGEIPRMGLLRDLLQEGLAPFGVEVETRPFRPHLTLGRFRKAPVPEDELQRLLTRHEALTSPEGVLRDLVLFKSDLKPEGPVYTRLEIWPLKGLS